MWRFDRLLDEEKDKRRTIADAVEVLCKHGNFRERDHAIIRVDPLQLPSSESIALVHAAFDSFVDNLTYFVWLPSSGKCKGRREGLWGLEVLDIFELSGGIIHFDGSVMLQNGTLLRAVEVIPALLPLELSDLDWCILHKTIAFMEIENCVYRSHWEGLDRYFQTGLPDCRSLDFGRLAGIKVPLLKQIRGYISEDKSVKTVPSEEKIAATLKKCGMRVPPPRPRKNFKAAVSRSP
jgi:hypothetical protein